MSKSSKTCDAPNCGVRLECTEGNNCRRPGSLPKLNEAELALLANAWCEGCKARVAARQQQGVARSAEGQRAQNWCDGCKARVAARQQQGVDRSAEGQRAQHVAAQALDEEAERIRREARAEAE
eukprot:CAMPEP_0181294396 /NCGR_PEP_ID=MMETSP1101-20121128/3577_1 /TAXON_ID=46948 /ORGANISM="Rhodomonas abbreviata, Strain Caron Lab Isolate" /LENGTH=123 /DNA_ID=CAMNT_0023399049 /DNA_START=164 /DNA_END=532 /DNA_ORIENTATION=-